MPPTVWDYEVDGWHFAIVRDDAQIAKGQMARPGTPVFTMRQAGLALWKHYNEIANITAPKDKPKMERKRTELEESLDDEIPH
jgi:hypothetical protein